MNDAARKAQRRAKIAAIAKTGDYNPAEAAVAQSMLERSPEGRLDVIAAQIRVEWGKGIEAQFAIGHLLIEAGTLFPPSARFQAVGENGRNTFAKGSPFGNWFAQQDFDFTVETARRLRAAAQREDEVRLFLSSRSTLTASGRKQRELAPATAIMYMNRTVVPQADIGPTVPVNPAYAALRDAKNRIVGTDEEPLNAFESMHVDDLAKSGSHLKALVEAYQVAKSLR